MKVAVIGGGAVGFLFSSYLTKVGIKHTIFTRTTDQANELCENGLQFKCGQQIENFKVQAKPLKNNPLSAFDLIIITVKQYHLDAIIPYLLEAKQSSLLFLQNGMGHLKILDNLHQEQIFVGVVEHGVLRNSRRSVIHTGVGQVKVSVFKGEKKVLQDFINKMSQANFPLILVNEWYEMLVKKLIANAIINPLTAIYRVKNGELINNPYFYEITKLVFEEVMSVLSFSKDKNIWKEVKQICKNTSENRSSMLKDIEEERPTEVDAILGYLLAEAESIKKSVPVLSFLYKSVKGIESHKGE